MNLWSNIPLSEYEGHMSNDNVRQLEALESVFSEKIEEYAPKSLMIWGIAGGNGLNIINPSVTERVVGLDINSDYLSVCKERYGDRIKDLELHCCDLNSESLPHCSVDFIWAALVLEYVNVPHALEYATKSLNDDGVISVLIQKDNGLKSVDSEYESINSLSDIFQVINEDSIKEYAGRQGLIISSEKEYKLESGKSFVVLDFAKVTNKKG